MFCFKCGNEIPDDSLFCAKCGAKQEQSLEESKAFQETSSIVHAKCTSCGAGLEVDPSKETAICPYCGDAYIVKKAINNYVINRTNSVNISGGNVYISSGPSEDELLKRADEFFDKKEYEKALDYYERVLDIASDNAKARQQSDFINNVYFESGSVRLTLLGLQFTEKKTNQKMLIPCKDIVAIRNDEKGKETESVVCLKGYRHFAITDVPFDFSLRCKKIMLYISYINDGTFEMEDCYYKERNHFWVFKDKIIETVDVNGKLGTKRIYIKDINNLKIKKALFVLKYVIFDGQVTLPDGQISSKKDDLSMMPMEVDKALAVINSIKAGEDVTPIGKEPILPLDASTNNNL